MRRYHKNSPDLLQGRRSRVGNCPPRYGKTKYYILSVVDFLFCLLRPSVIHNHVIIEELTNHCVEAGMLNFQLDLPFLKISIVKIYQ